MDINKLQELLYEFGRIPKKDIIPPTYLEIAGQPHYENVCSNILKFYFDTNEQHKLKDLLLKALLSCLDDKYKDYSFESINIEREYFTANNNRIDLVIECSNLVVVIENKIEHWVANDLKDYQKCIEETFKDKDRIFILLSLNKLKKEDLQQTQFENITYEQFFQNLKQNLGTYFIHANNQYIIFLLDFIKTIENFINPMEKLNKEFFNFYVKHQELINEMCEEKNEMYKFLYSFVDTIFNKLQDKKINNVKKDKTGCIYYEIQINKKIVVFDIYFELNNIAYKIYFRGWEKDKNYDFLNKLKWVKENKKNLEKSSTDGYIIEQKFNLEDISNELSEEFANKLEKIYKEIKIAK